MAVSVVVLLAGCGGHPPNAAPPPTAARVTTVPAAAATTTAPAVPAHADPAAKQVITRVVDAVESYGWDRTPTGQITPIRSLLTPALAAQLAAAPVSPAQRAAWTADHFEADATVRGIQIVGHAGDQVDATVLYDVTEHPAGAADGLLSVVAVALGPTWIVASLRPYTPPPTGASSGAGTGAGG